jgi:hypothetical protein
MNHYPAFLRPHHGKSTNSTSTSSSSNNENDENSTIKNLIFKHLSKAQQSSTTNPNGNKGTMRGILGEVGNMTLSNKPIISKPKIIPQNSVSTIIESQSIISIPPPAPPPPSTITTIVDNQIEEIILDDDFESLIEVPAEFDCDSSDLYNITTVSEFVVDICKYWRELEQCTPIRQNFLLHRREGRF